MANTNKIYSDIDFTFTKKPVVGDIALSYDSQAVIRSIRNLLQTKHFERPFNSLLGSKMEALLFEPLNNITSTLLESEIKTMVKNFEPRASISSVVVNALEERNAYNVTITFFLENATTPTTVTMLLQRDR